MLLRQSLKTSANSMEFLNFVQDRLKRHEYPALGRNLSCGRTSDGLA